MDPSNNNSFGSFSYGGQAGVGAPVQQDIFLDPAAPKKKSKKWLVLVVLLVVLVCAGVGVMLVLNNRFSADNDMGVLDSFERAVNYAYYCNENSSIDLADMQPSESCLAEMMGQVSVFAKDDSEKKNVSGDTEKVFEKIISLFEAYKKRFDENYNNDVDENGYIINSNNKYILDILNFLKIYTTKMPVISNADFALAKKDYIDKFNNIAALGSGVADDYVGVQEYLYDVTVGMANIYLEKGCDSGFDFTSGCVTNIELNDEEREQLDYIESVKNSLENVGMGLVKDFFRRCNDNEALIMEDENKNDEE